MERKLAGKASALTPARVPVGAVARVADLAPARDPEVTQLLVLLTALARRNDAVLAELAAPHGLLPSETAVLVTLWWAGPPHELRPTVLADALQQTSGGMTATLRRLTDAGFVVRRPDPDDGRVVLARLTAEGERAARAALDAQVSHWEAALARFSPAAVRRARETVGDLLAALLDIAPP